MGHIGYNDISYYKISVLTKLFLDEFQKKSKITTYDVDPIIRICATDSCVNSFTLRQFLSFLRQRTKIKIKLDQAKKVESSAHSDIPAIMINGPILQEKINGFAIIMGKRNFVCSQA